MSLTNIIPYSCTVFCLALALSTLVRAGRYIDRWSFAIGMLALAMEAMLAAFNTSVSSVDAMVNLQQWRLVFVSIIPGIWLLFSLSYSRIDAYKLLTSKLYLWLPTIIIPMSLVAYYWDSLFITWYRSSEANSWAFRVGRPAIALHVVALVTAVAGLMNLEASFRASVGTMRWRIKYMILGVGLILLARLYTSSQIMLYRGIDLSIESVNPIASLVACLLIVRSFSRSGHFELELYPSQTVLQGSLTAILAGIYLLIIGVLAKVVTLLGGDTTFTLKAFLILVSLVLLGLLLQSDRVRLRIRHFVSRNFSRPLYDYRSVWRKFTEGTATHMEQAEFCRGLVKSVADVVQALSVTIWLVDETRGVMTLGASSSQDNGHTSDRNLSLASMNEIIRHFHTAPDPIEFESIKEPWAEGLRTAHPVEFHNGGNRVCIPIKSRGEVLGLITMCDRIGGVPFCLQDYDMFRCIAEHAAANLINIHLSQKLLQAKELESFQKMAAFFVHDLKNAASTLNLMLKNLPVHFNDPAFQEDALRGIAKTVTRINDLTGRLNTLRHEMKVNPTEADLNELITQAMGTVQLGAEVAMAKDLGQLPKFHLDKDQISKVLVNLLLNAGEAMGGRGQLRVTSSMIDGWAIITVRDSGCGMSPEFVSNSLFRPFQTTKKTGLGIGMFQCKAIVEAHGGKITVASERGMGTIFQVFLPFTPIP